VIALQYAFDLLLVERVLTEEMHGWKIQRMTAHTAFGILEDLRPAAANKQTSANSTPRDSVHSNYYCVHNRVAAAAGTAEK